MIVYPRGPYGILSLLGGCGSVLPRTAAIGALSAAVAVALELVGAGPAISKWWRSAVLPYQLFAFIVGFVVTFRASLSYNRYWRAAESLITLQGKLVALVALAATVDGTQADPGSAADAAGAAGRAQFAARLASDASALHALMLQALRQDGDLRNLVPHRRDEGLTWAHDAPAAAGGRGAADAAAGPAGPYHSGRFSSSGGWFSGSASPSACADRLPLSVSHGAASMGTWSDAMMRGEAEQRASEHAGARCRGGGAAPGGLLQCFVAGRFLRRSPCSHACSDLSPVLPVLQGHAAAPAPAAAGEGQGAAAPAVAVAAAAADELEGRPDARRRMPLAAQAGEPYQHTLQRAGLQHAHHPHSQQQQQPHHHQQHQHQHQQQQQQQQQQHQHQHQHQQHSRAPQQRHDRDDQQRPPHHPRGAAAEPLRARSLVALRPALRADAAFHAVYERLARRREEGGLAQQAPLLAGLFGRLKAAFACFHELLAVAAVPFPFPWAQMDVFLLLVHTIATPVVVVAFLDQAAMCAAVAFITVLAYVATNEVARAIEEPFQLTPNGLPLLALQRQLNERLLVVAESAGGAGDGAEAHGCRPVVLVVA